ncbi:hypothetical protein [Haloprofundus halobius]|uniref:hypothetical protein n=1 Tax=Haloprofundus halobius TaxID=2876194 RepID=UPI001CC93275|nr:hypothetical protein [Haloprofundus halobius]
MTDVNGAPAGLVAGLVGGTVSLVSAVTAGSLGLFSLSVVVTALVSVGVLALGLVTAWNIIRAYSGGVSA